MASSESGTTYMRRRWVDSSEAEDNHKGPSRCYGSSGFHVARQRYLHEKIAPLCANPEKACPGLSLMYPGLQNPKNSNRSTEVYFVMSVNDIKIV